MRSVIVATALVLSGCLFSAPSSGGTPDGDAAVDAGGAADASGVRDSGSDAPDSPGDECGNGSLEAGEKCDPGLPSSSPGACPDSCDDGVACTRGELRGSPETCDAVCASAVVTECTNGDGCCPSGCGPDVDDDCVARAVCGDGQVTEPELCDPAIDPDLPGSCPVTTEECDEEVCRKVQVVGAAQNCDAHCAYSDVTACVDDDGCCPAGCDMTNDGDCESVCGNELIEPGETCDGDCPASEADCPQGGACSDVLLIGSAGTCDAVCELESITACVDGDGCCPSTCSSANDSDCSGTCGDNVVDPGETCDPPSSCPADCDDSDACTTDTLNGSAQNCNAECTYSAITACKSTSDGCCPAGCNANTDADCAPDCGNGVVESGETCDGSCPADCDDGNACTQDKMVGNPANCDAECQHEVITACADGDGCCAAGCNANNDDDCNATCGNGIVEGDETCDGDCPADCDDSDACTIDTSSGSASSCDFACSHNVVSNCVDADGCCPASCTANNDTDCSPSCGNGTVEGDEKCDGDCPTSCPDCEVLIGSGCDRECVDDPNCQTCVLGGDCSCDDPDICESGLCANDPSGGVDCTSACDPTAYCKFYWGFSVCLASGECVECGQDSDCGSGAPFCVDGWCTECTSDADCGGAEWCDGGFCGDPGDCLLANDPDEWCETHEPVTGSAVVCIDYGFATGSCFVACPSQEVCDCPNWYDRCVAHTDGTMFCEPFSDRCDGACLPDQWCRNSYGSGNYLCADPFSFDGCCPSADNINCD